MSYDFLFYYTRHITDIVLAVHEVIVITLHSSHIIVTSLQNTQNSFVPLVTTLTLTVILDIVELLLLQILYNYDQTPFFSDVGYTGCPRCVS